LKRKADAMESRNNSKSATNKVGEGNTIVECCLEAQNLNKNFQAKVFGKMIHYVKVDKSRFSIGKTSASLIQGKFEESILDAKELSRWSEMLKSELNKLRKLTDNDKTLQLSDSITLRDTISELLESEGIINKSLLALNHCNIHERQNLTEDCSKPEMIRLVIEKKKQNVHRPKAHSMPNNKQTPKKKIHKIIITQLEDETQNMPVSQTDHLARPDLNKQGRRRSSTISSINIDAFRRKNIHCRKYWGSKNVSDVDSNSPQSEKDFSPSKMVKGPTNATINVESLESQRNCDLVSANSGDEHPEVESVQTIPENRVIHHRTKRAKSMCASLLTPSCGTESVTTATSQSDESEESVENWWTKQQKFKLYQYKMQRRKRDDSFLEQFRTKRCHSLDLSSKNTRTGSHSEAETPVKTLKKKVIIKEPLSSYNATAGDSPLRKRRMTPYVGNMSCELQFSSKLSPQNKSNLSEPEKLLPTE